MGVDWGDGDHARTADVLGPASRALVEAVGAGPGRRVLDVGRGTGNAALAAAARRASCVGADVPGLVAQARRRAAAAGAPAEFVVGDAAALPVADGSFDAAVSAFGVIFAEEPAAAMAERARAVRPGGAVALATWLPEGPIATAGRLLRAALPPGDAPPARWDDLASGTR
jgi:ubiquinone/menaquinone biosynthesis C-methylase UbiE